MSELAIKHRDKVKLYEAPTGVENVQIILEAIDKQKGIACDYYSFDRATKKQQLLIPYFLKTTLVSCSRTRQPSSWHINLCTRKNGQYQADRTENVAK